jgi:hypothetical protein
LIVSYLFLFDDPIGHMGSYYWAVDRLHSLWAEEYAPLWPYICPRDPFTAPGLIVIFLISLLFGIDNETISHELVKKNVFSNIVGNQQLKVAEYHKNHTSTASVQANPYHAGVAGSCNILILHATDKGNAGIFSGKIIDLL